MGSPRTKAGTGQGVVWEWAPLVGNDYASVPTTGWAKIGILVTGDVDASVDEVESADLSHTWDEYLPTTGSAEGSVTVRHAQGDPGSQTLTGWLGAPQIVWFRITEKDGSKIHFAGFTKGYKITFARKDIVDAEVPIRANTCPDFIPAS